MNTVQKTNKTTKQLAQHNGPGVCNTIEVYGQTEPYTLFLHRQQTTKLIRLTLFCVFLFGWHSPSLKTNNSLSNAEGLYSFHCMGQLASYVLSSCVYTYVFGKRLKEHERTSIGELYTRTIKKYSERFLKNETSSRRQRVCSGMQKVTKNTVEIVNTASIEFMKKKLEYSMYTLVSVGKKRTFNALFLFQRDGLL